MKLHFIVLWLCIGVTACAHQSHIEQPHSAPPVTDTTYIRQSALLKSKPSAHAVAIKVNEEATDCHYRITGLNDNPCNLQAWQNYLADLLSTSESQRQQQLNQLGATDVDHLKRVLLLIHQNENPDLRAQSIQELERTLSRYNLAMQDFLYIVIAFNNNLLTHEQRAAISKIEIEKLKAQLSTTQKLLNQAQSKIDAITNIEQQLNVEGSLPNENNSGP